MKILIRLDYVRIKLKLYASEHVEQKGTACIYFCSVHSFYGDPHEYSFDLIVSFWTPSSLPSFCETDTQLHRDGLQVLVSRKLRVK